MKKYPHPLIAREGWPFVIGAWLVAMFSGVLLPVWAALLCWIVFIFVLQFFRDPPREIPSQPGVVLSPADGRVVAVEKTQDPYADREALKISVFMNVFNVHSNRVPVDGTIGEIRYFPGKFFNADLDKASLENERNALIIRTAEGQTVNCVQVAGLIARRILCYVKTGDAVQRGQRYGFIRFGSRVDIYLPPDAKPRTAIGEKIYASSSVIAEF